MQPNLDTRRDHEIDTLKALKASESQTLLIRGDQNVLLGKAVDIMSVARKAGAKSIGILTKKK